MAQIRYRNNSGGWSNPKAIRTWTGSEWKQRMGYRWTGSQWNPIIQYTTDVVKNGIWTPTNAVQAFGQSGNGPEHGYTTGGLGSYYYVAANADSIESCNIFVRSQSSYNLTPYTTLNFEVSVTWSGDGHAAIHVYAPYPTANYNPYASRYFHQSNVTKQTFTLDVTALSGNYSIGAEAFAGDSNNESIYIYNMWLS